MHAGSYPFCPGKEAALVIIVVSLPYTAYLCASSIVLQIAWQRWPCLIQKQITHLAYNNANHD